MIENESLGLSELQRVYISSQAEGGCGTAEITNHLGCSQRAVTLQKVTQRWETEGAYTRHDRVGRPPKIMCRQYRQLLPVVKKCQSRCCGVVSQENLCVTTTYLHMQLNHNA